MHVSCKGISLIETVPRGNSERLRGIDDSKVDIHHPGKVRSVITKERLG